MSNDWKVARPIINNYLGGFDRERFPDLRPSTTSSSAITLHPAWRGPEAPFDQDGIIPPFVRLISMQGAPPTSFGSDEFPPTLHAGTGWNEMNTEHHYRHDRRLFAIEMIGFNRRFFSRPWVRDLVLSVIRRSRQSRVDCLEYPRSRYPGIL